MPPFFVRDRCLLVPSLVVANDLAGVAQFRNSSTSAKDHRAALVQRPANLLRGDLRIFPPAAALCASPRIPIPPGPAPDVGAGPSNLDLQNASSLLLAWPGGTSVPRSSGGTPRPTPAPTVR